MKRTLAGSTLLLALLAGCATTAGGPGTSSRFKQADQKFPPQEREFSDDVERGYVQNINTHHRAGGHASQSGAMDQARPEWATEAQALADFADKFPSSEWAPSFRFNAGKYFYYAEQYAKSVDQADKLLLSPDANDVSRAMAAKLAFTSGVLLAQDKAQKRQLEPLRLLVWEERKATPLAPRPPVGEWKRVVEYADTYVKFADQDPDLKKDPKERFITQTPAQISLTATQVKFAFDNMEDARARFARSFEAWPAEIDLGAVKLYLSTYSALGDQAGYDAALPRLKQQVADAAAKATDPKQKESLARAQERLAQLDVEAAYNQAKRQQDAGQYLPAAAAFEAFIAANPANPNVPLAMFQAAYCYEKANQPDKAVAVREQLMARYPDSKQAEQAMPLQAELRVKQGKRDEAVGIYRAFIAKYPDSEWRCNVLYNIGSTLDGARKDVDAAVAYLDFGREARCAKADPNAAARLLYRAGELSDKSRKMPDAKKAYQACTEVGGVTDVVVKSYQAEAKRRAKR